MAEEGKPTMSMRKELLKQYEQLCKDAKNLVYHFPLEKIIYCLWRYSEKKLYYLTG